MNKSKILTISLFSLSGIISIYSLTYLGHWLGLY